MTQRKTRALVTPCEALSDHRIFGHCSMSISETLSVSRVAVSEVVSVQRLQNNVSFISFACFKFTATNIKKTHNSLWKLAREALSITTIFQHCLL